MKKFNYFDLEIETKDGWVQSPSYPFMVNTIKERWVKEGGCRCSLNPSNVLVAVLPPQMKDGEVYQTIHFSVASDSSLFGGWPCQVVKKGKHCFINFLDDGKFYKTIRPSSNYSAGKRLCYDPQNGKVTEQ